jgi:hypothetical protein
VERDREPHREGQGRRPDFAGELGSDDSPLVHRGQSNFAINAFAADGSSDQIVNEIGHYDGETTLMDGTDLLAIDADGAWSVAVTGG